MVLDLNQNGHPVIESPHAMNIHESPVTCMAYYSDCPLDLIGALTLVGTKQRNKEFSARVRIERTIRVYNLNLYHILHETTENRSRKGMERKAQQNY